MAQIHSYAESGVDTKAADQFVDQIAVLSRATLNRNVKSSIGGYASLYAIGGGRHLAASTDGVGTKLKLAFRLGEHRTVGIDLVAMSVNDLLCVGAMPLFFLDYFATGKLKTEVATRVLGGIVRGCREAQCALVGGETAEMPDFYPEGEYDLAGFAVGMVESKNVLPRKDIRPGDALIGIASSGCHSNGYSLLRKLLPEGPEGDERARELLTPTQIYVRSLKPLISSRKFKGLAHITGSGFLNVPRMSEKVSYEIYLPSFAERPPVFSWVQERSGLSLSELAQTFNLGVGMVAVVAEKDVATVLRKLKQHGEKAFRLGAVVKRGSRKSSEVHVFDGPQSVTLKY